MANTSAIWQQAAHTTYHLWRVEMKQLREAWRSCTRDNVEADESYSVSLSAQTLKVMVIV